eukprot:m.425831 g.425831  ORF g.425831 m.425831 type:complete len:882 (+) comp21348_c0_seq3:166-2811(+)
MSSSPNSRPTGHPDISALSPSSGSSRIGDGNAILLEHERIKRENERLVEELNAAKASLAAAENVASAAEKTKVSNSKWNGFRPKSSGWGFSMGTVTNKMSSFGSFVARTSSTAVSAVDKKLRSSPGRARDSQMTSTELSTSAYSSLTLAHPSTVSMFAPQSHTARSICTSKNKVSATLKSTFEKMKHFSSQGIRTLSSAVAAPNNSQPYGEVRRSQGGLSPRTSNNSGKTTHPKDSDPREIIDAKVELIPEYFEALLNPCSDGDQKFRAIQCLRILAQQTQPTHGRGELEGQNPAQIIASNDDGVRALLNLLYNADVCVECAWTLQCLAGNGNEDNVAKMAIENASGVVMLMDIIQMDPITESKQPMLPARCLACLYNLCIVSEPLRDLLAANASFVAILFEMLQECAPSLARKAAIRMLTMLATGCDAWKQALAASSAIQRLCDTLPAEYDRVVMHGVISCLGGLVDENAARLDQLRQVSDIRPKLHALLETGDKHGMAYLSMATLSRLSSQAFNQHIVGAIVGRPTGPAAMGNTDSQCAKDVAELLARLENPDADEDPDIATAVAGNAATVETSATGGGNWVNRFLPFRKDSGASPAKTGSPTRTTAVAVDVPVLDARDPKEVMLRQVTEQTLRREFQTSGGQCTPLQIALRFKQQLNDPDYGSENRVRFRDVIDRIAEPKTIQDPATGALTQVLVLKEAHGEHALTSGCHRRQRSASSSPTGSTTPSADAPTSGCYTPGPTASRADSALPQEDPDAFDTSTRDDTGHEPIPFVFPIDNGASPSSRAVSLDLGSTELTNGMTTPVRLPDGGGDSYDELFAGDGDDVGGTLHDTDYQGFTCEHSANKRVLDETRSGAGSGLNSVRPLNDSTNVPCTDVSL